MIDWQWDWRPFDAPEKECDFARELRRELHRNPRHMLHGRDFTFVGWRERGWKHFIIHLPAENRYAFVHLTWSEETDPRWPYVELLDDVESVNDFLRHWCD